LARFGLAPGGWPSHVPVARSLRPFAGSAAQDGPVMWKRVWSARLTTWPRISQVGNAEASRAAARAVRYAGEREGAPEEAWRRFVDLSTRSSTTGHAAPAPAVFLKTSAVESGEGVGFARRSSW